MLIATGTLLRELFTSPADDARIRITVIVPRFKCQSCALRPNAIEERHVLLGLQKARHTLILRAMPLCDQGRFFDITGETDLGGASIALQQKGLRPRTAGAKCPEENRKEKEPHYVAIRPA